MLPAFEYFHPKTLPEASDLLFEYGEKAQLIAGGTDLVVKMKRNAIRPSCLIDLKRIPNLDRVRWDGEFLKVGSLAKLRTIETNELIRKDFGIISEAAGSIGSVQVRNLGTIGGNICNASPASDAAPALLAVDALVELFGAKGRRTIPLDSFFTGVGKTNLRSGEILTEFWLPRPAAKTGRAFIKHGARNAMDIATVNVAVQIILNKYGLCDCSRVALGSVSPIPMRSLNSERILEHSNCDDEVILKAAMEAAKEVVPISDIRGSAWYRKDLTEVLTKRALKNAFAEAGGA